MDKILLKELERDLDGDLKIDVLSKTLYATDASVYRKIPLAAAFPKTIADIQKLIHFATKHQIGLIPRAAGTSLAGQCVGEGIVVDTSVHFTNIVSLDKEKRQVKVQPGVIRDELNLYLKPYGLFFGPNTSTSNRCMIGGMVGNNSSGTTSIQYGVTRDKVIAMQTILSDGSQVTFKSLSKKEFEGKPYGNTFEASLYRDLLKELYNKEIQKEINDHFPKKSIHRRNTGYAVDELLNSTIFEGGSSDFNLCNLLCGSEGTLAFTTEITLQLDDLPPPLSAMVVTHYHTLEDSLSDVVPTMRHSLHTCEMMDKVILDCTKNNREQIKNRFFVEGDPVALLMLEVRADSESALDDQLKSLQETIAKSGLSYASPVLKGRDINKALELRKAGLGLLGNMVGDRKAVACIEDTAVALEDLKDFIAEFSQIMKGYNQKAVYYAHAGAGELHLRPILNLKKKEDVSLFRAITTDVARLTKKYKGKTVPVRGKQCSTEQMPFLESKMPTYSLFANSSVEDIYGSEKINEADKMEVTSFQSKILWNEGGGNYTSSDLPFMAQLSPILDAVAIDVNGDNIQDLILGGNILDTEPETPTYDSGKGVIIYGSNDKNLTAEYNINKTGLYFNNNTRQLGMVRLAGNQTGLICAPNNSYLQIFLKL